MFWPPQIASLSTPAFDPIHHLPYIHHVTMWTCKNHAQYSIPCIVRKKGRRTLDQLHTRDNKPTAKHLGSTRVQIVKGGVQNLAEEERHCEPLLSNDSMDLFTVSQMPRPSTLACVLRVESPKQAKKDKVSHPSLTIMRSFCPHTQCATSSKPMGAFTVHAWTAYALGI